MKLKVNNNCESIRVTELDNASIIEGNLEGNVTLNCCDTEIAFSKEMQTTVIDGCDADICSTTYCVNLLHTAEEVETMRDTTCVGANCGTPDVCCNVSPYDAFTQLDIDNLACTTGTCTADTEFWIYSITLRNPDGTTTIINSLINEWVFTCNDNSLNKVVEDIADSFAKETSMQYNDFSVTFSTGIDGHCKLCFTFDHQLDATTETYPESIIIIAHGTDPVIRVYNVEFTRKSMCNSNGEPTGQSVDYVDITPEDLGQTGISLIDGIYTITSGEDSSCIAVLCKHKCVVIERMDTLYKAGKTEEAIALYLNYEGLLRGDNCDCSCDALCDLYENLLKELGEISQTPDTNC